MVGSKNESFAKSLQGRCSRRYISPIETNLPGGKKCVQEGRYAAWQLFELDHYKLVTNPDTKKGGNRVNPGSGLLKILGFDHENQCHRFRVASAEDRILAAEHFRPDSWFVPHLTAALAKASW